MTTQRMGDSSSHRDSHSTRREVVECIQRWNIRLQKPPPLNETCQSTQTEADDRWERPKELKEGGPIATSIPILENAQNWGNCGEKRGAGRNTWRSRRWGRSRRRREGGRGRGSRRHSCAPPSWSFPLPLRFLFPRHDCLYYQIDLPQETVIRATDRDAKGQNDTVLTWQSPICQLL